ncbi:MAG: UbiX family flavin prenyltransferase [Magnetococcales bacterium]|nr:UbiX family flavin prenyltransferase [Magnetococcales bacterium]
MGDSPPLPPVTVALTGASGAIYGLRLVARLLEAGHPVRLLLSRAARLVIRQEQGLSWEGADEDGPRGEAFWRDHFRPHCRHGAEQLNHYALQDWTSPLASGSGAAGPMVICPCTMGTLAAVAQGLSDSLIERGADVTLKEGRLLILVPRETPLTTIHLENMLKLARMGAVILPAMPGFYHRPQRVEELVEFVVERILARLGTPLERAVSWPPANVAL